MELKGIYCLLVSSTERNYYAYCFKINLKDKSLKSSKIFKFVLIFPIMSPSLYVRSKNSPESESESENFRRLESESESVNFQRLEWESESESENFQTDSTSLA